MKIRKKTNLKNPKKKRRIKIFMTTSGSKTENGTKLTWYFTIIRGRPLRKENKCILAMEE